MELPAQGESFQRKYKLHEVLGKGGFAAVYRATDLEIGRDVAIKVLAPSGDGYSQGIESRFMREARVIASLQDPHTITMFEFGRSDDGLLFMVFEYVRGNDLSTLIRRNPLPESATIHIMQQVLQSLREAHSAGVLHRDIKPANILIYEYMDDPYRAKLLDFGIAKPVAGAGDGMNITSDGAMIGTPRYMAPEQIYAGELTAASDVYSLGLVSYEMLVGAPAITGRTAKEMMVQQLTDDPVQLPHEAMVSPALRNVINRMTSRDPAGRFATADHVLQALDFVESQSGPLGPAVSGPHPGWSSGNHPAQHSGPQPAYDSRPPQDPNMRPAFQPSPTPAGPSTPTGPSGVHRSWTDRSVNPYATQRLAPEQPPAKSGSALTLIIGGIVAGAGIVSVLMLAKFLMNEEAPQPVFSVTSQKGPLVTTQPTPQPDMSASLADAAVTDVGTDSGSRAQTLGCGLKAGWTQSKEFTASNGFGRRNYTVYLPRKYDENRKHPIVMLFHKAFNDGDWIVKDTNIKPIADAGKFIVLSFHADDKTQPWKNNDHEYIKLALKQTADAVCVDTARVFAVGHGGGGDFVRELACDIPLAGIGTAGSGEARGYRGCEPSPPVPFIRMAGMDDNYLPVKGGPGCLGGNHKSLEQIESEWKERNRCDSKRKQWTKRRSDVCWTWSCEAPLVSCHVRGGHDWPDSTPEKFEMPGCPHPPPSFPMMKNMWKFFDEQQPIETVNP